MGFVGINPGGTILLPKNGGGQYQEPTTNGELLHDRWFSEASSDF